MPCYLFECRDCGTKDEVVGSMANPPQPGVCSCGAEMFRIWGHHVDTFKPFWDTNSLSKPVYIETREQRESFLDRHNLTYDSGKYVRRPVYRPASADITLEDLDRELKENGPSEPFRGDVGTVDGESIETVDLGDGSGD